jgi:hypothetical protein
MNVQSPINTATKKFKIPKINFLDPATFNTHRRKISTKYYYDLEQAHETFKSKSARLQLEIDVIENDIRSSLSQVIDVPFARSRFINHDIRRCRCKFCNTWNYRKFIVNMLEEIEDKRKIVIRQYDEAFLYINGLRSKDLDKLKKLRLMQLADQRRHI